MNTFFAQLPVERLGWVLIHSLWQFLAIALVVRLIERAFAGRNGASLRHAAGLCGLAAMTAGPVVTWFFVLESPSASSGAAVVSVEEGVERPEARPGASRISHGLPNVSTTLNNPAMSPTDVLNQPAVNSLADAWSAGWTTFALRLRPWLPMLVMGWLVGMSCCSLRPLVGWLTLHRLRTVGVSKAGKALKESARQIAARLRMTQTVSVWQSTLAKTPLVVGYLRPMLLIPVAMVAQLPLAELEAILAHELAHIRRHDFLINLWQTSLETICFYHPAVWSLSHRLRAEREHCCDDLALSVIGDPVCYGRALLHVEELRGPEPLLALGAGGGSLRGRILRVLGQPSPPASSAGLVAGLLLPSVALASVLAAIAWGQPVGNDEKKPATADLIKQLSDPSQAKRDAAAAELRKSFVPPPRQTWQEKVARVKSGLTREEALAAIGIMKREPDGTLPDEIAVDYRLDEVWVARLWLTRRVTPTTVTKAELVESVQRFWVNPPADFTGRWTTYHVNGHKSHTIDYRNGKYDGEFIGHHSNGQPNVVQHYSFQHGAHGEDAGYYPSGKLSYRGRYFRGARIGDWIHYEEEGRVRSREQLPVPPEAKVVLNEQAKEKAEAKPPPKPEPAPADKPKPAARSLDIVIAQHVILWDGRIRTWDEVVTELREIRKTQGKPIHPNFYFTNGAHSAGHWDTYKAKAFEVYKEIFEPAGISLGGISPRAGPRYDVVRKAQDLVPDPNTLRSGVVIEKGQPKAGVLVVLVPEEGSMPVTLKRDLTLRDPLDEVWTVTGPDGRFTIPVQPVHAIDKLTEPPTYALAAITPTSYRLAAIPVEGDEAKIELQPLARVKLTPVEGKPQQIDLSFRGGLPDTSPGFNIYELELADKPLPINLPPGKITTMRSYLHKDGGSRSYPAETVWPGAGESLKVKLPNLTEEDAEQKWREDSLKPKRDAKEQAGQPKEKSGARLTVKFDIPGAEDVAKMALRNVAKDEYVGTEELWKGIARYKVNSVKNGESFEFQDLAAGEYEFVRSAPVVGQPRLALDRQKLTLAAGEQKSIEISRPKGKRITGRILNRGEFQLEYALIWVCPVSVKEVPRPAWVMQDGIDLTASDGEGSFTTAPVSPGRYAILVEGWEPPPQGLSGLHRPRYLGRAEVTVPEVGEPAPVKVKFVDKLEDIEWANFVRGKPAQRIIELLKPAWGKSQLGIEFGVSHTTDQRRFAAGQRVPLAMFVRNASDNTVKVELGAEFLANVPDVRDSKGNAIPIETLHAFGSVALYRETLKPGEAFCFQHLGIGLGPNPLPGQQNWNPHWEKPVAGKYTLRHTHSISVEPTDVSASRGESFTSGTISFEVLGK